MQNESDDYSFFVDTLNGDVFEGGDGVDAVTYSSRVDPVHLTLSVSGDSIAFIGGVAEDTVRNVEDVIGGSGDDILTGSDVENVLWGMGGDDRLYGRDGQDMLNGGDGEDYLDGGGGSDWALYKYRFVPIHITLSGSEDSIVYVDGVAEDIVRNIECLQGGFVDDILVGDDRDNVLMGEMGRDLLVGGGGSDVFTYEGVLDRGDTIQDFNADEGDKIAFFDFLLYVQDDRKLSFTGTDPAPYAIWYEAAGNGHGVVVKADTNGESEAEEFWVTLNGVSSLSADDFILG